MTGRIRRWYLLCLLALIGVLALHAQHSDFYGLYFDYKASHERVRTLELDLTRAETERVLLERQVEHLNTSPLEIEAAIRRTKSLVRAGEIVYRVKLPEDALE